MLSLRSLILVLLTLLLCLDIAAAERYPIQRRADSSLPAPTGKVPSLSTSSSSSTAQSDGSLTTQAPSSSESISATLSSTTSSDASTSSAYTETTSASTTGVSGTPVPSASAYNVTLTPDDLPITPQLTPGFGFAGVLLILSGSIYALVGLRNKWIHIFLSAAYLVSLAVTVLIIYVMNTPVSDGIQGAYVAAITLTGLILGAAALLLREMTEGLGCLFGGFCLAMWLLVLKPGGLLTGTAPVVIFIVCFTLLGWSISFSKFTRPYALIVLLSFGGATTLVLGIDCFSRAGLKEFWAYIWNLNTNLFPLGATTYPITRGMKVEIAAIIIVFLVGIASQTKLWKTIKKRRERRALDRLPHELNFRREEELVGRRIENATARQRVYWEAVYGNKGSAPSADSGIGSQNGGGDSTVPSTRHSAHEGIEMDQISNAPAVTRNAPEMDPKAQPSFVVRVVADDDIASEHPNEPRQGGLDANRLSHRSSRHSTTNSHRGSTDRFTSTVVSDGEAGRSVSRQDSKRTLRRVSGGPDVVPLPFKVPRDEGGDNSSLATIADDDKSHRLSARLSRTSDLLRSLSHRSQSRPDGLSRNPSISTEHLVQPDDADDGRSSRAATVDDLSDDDDFRRFVEESPERPSSNEQPDLGELPEQEAMEKGNDQQTTEATLGMDREISSAMSSNLNTTATERRPLTVARESEGVKSQKAQSRLSNPITADHIPVSLTKTTLPPALPRVASSYRTNEWAKHLSNADAPEFEEIKLPQEPARDHSNVQEAPVLVNVEALQQTPETAQIPPAPRSASRSSNHPYQSIRSLKNVHVGTLLTMTPSASQQSLLRPTLQPMQGMRSYRSNSASYIGQALVESPMEGIPQEFPPSNTLLDQRDSIIRNKSALGYNASQSTPAAVSRRASETRLSTIYDPGLDDDSVSLSARRSALRQSSLMNALPHAQNAPFDSHQPRRQSSTPVNSAAKEAQLAQWRASMQQEIEAKVPSKKTMEKSRSTLLQERMSVERQRDMEQTMKEVRDKAIDERMRKGDMLEAHKEAMRRMQREANRNL